MSDLIDRQAAINAINSWFEKAKHPMNRGAYNNGEVAAYSTAISEIENLPSAEQGQHGRWEFIGDQMFRCPECGQTFSKMLLEGWGTYLDRLYLPPCPICGADMIGEQDEY